MWRAVPPPVRIRLAVPATTVAQLTTVPLSRLVEIRRLMIDLIAVTILLPERGAFGHAQEGDRHQAQSDRFHRKLLLQNSRVIDSGRLMSLRLTTSDAADVAVTFVDYSFQWS